MKQRFVIEFESDNDLFDSLGDLSWVFADTPHLEGNVVIYHEDYPIELRVEVKANNGR